MKKFFLTALAATLFAPAALAGNTVDDHNDLWQAVEDAGVEVQTNHPKHCKDAWGGGFYANFRDFRGARVSTLTPHVLKPNADPVVLT